MRWRDSGGESGGCLREVLLESHLAFEVREDALDHQPRRGECALAAEIGGGARLVGGEQGDAVGGEPLAVAATPETLVGDDDLGRDAGQKVGERLVLLLVGGHDRVPERQAAFVGQEDEPDAPDEAVLRARVAVASEAGEVASLLAAGIVGDRRAGCRRRAAHRRRRASRASCCCTIEISSTRPRRRRLYCDWSGRCGNQPGSTRPIRPRNCRSELIPIAACATASATSSASVVNCGRPQRAGTRYSSAKT